MPLFLRLVFRIRAVEVGPEDRARVRALRGAAALVVGNHPSLAEPAVLWRLVREEAISCYQLTAWDTLTAGGRFSAMTFQRLGAYSVRRGRRDRASMEMTEKLLAAGERVLLFPEG